MQDSAASRTSTRRTCRVSDLQWATARGRRNPCSAAWRLPSAPWARLGFAQRVGRPPPYAERCQAQAPQRFATEFEAAPVAWQADWLRRRRAALIAAVGPGPRVRAAAAPLPSTVLAVPRSTAGRLEEPAAPGPGRPPRGAAAVR